MYVSTVLTCHECKHQSLFLVSEWPPQITLCPGCGQMYKLIETPGDGASFGLVPYKLL